MYKDHSSHLQDILHLLTRHDVGQPNGEHVGGGEEGEQGGPVIHQTKLRHYGVSEHGLVEGDSVRLPAIDRAVQECGCAGVDTHSGRSETCEDY